MIPQINTKDKVAAITSKNTQNNTDDVAMPTTASERRKLLNSIDNKDQYSK